MNNNSIKLKNKVNYLNELVVNNESIILHKETIKKLCRHLLEPVLKTKEEAVIIVNLNNNNDFENILKRVNFINPNIFSLKNNLNFLKNQENNRNFASLEFVLISSSRYNAMVIWDYEKAKNLGYDNSFATANFKINSKKVTQVLQNISDLSSFDLKIFLEKFNPERRTNETMNITVSEIISDLNNQIQEISISQAETQKAIQENDDIEKYKNIINQISTTSHEIKNQLSIIDIYTKIIEKTLTKANVDFDNKSINIINNAIISINSLLNNLKKQETSISVQNLKNIITDAISATQAKINIAQVECILENNQDIFVKCDKLKLKNVLINLIYNAIDAIKENGQIIISYDNKNIQNAKITIKDNGKGICETIKENLFSQGLTTKQTGEGLGLNICKRNMLEQNGNITLIKSDEKGTEFELTIPLA